MIRTCSLTVLAGLILAAAAPAQSAGCFRFQAGQVLTYRAEETTTVAEVVGDSKVETRTKLNLTKQWKVLDVDTAGTATVQMSLASLRHEITTPNGETLLYDSAEPDKSNPQMREQLSRYIGQPLHVLAISAQGQVVQVKECKFGAPSRFESKVPFEITLPAEALAMGQTWERPYNITLDPPHGTGEKFAAVQNYTCKKLDSATATISLATTVKAMPENVMDRVPLLQFQPEGEVVFDLQAGCLRSVQLHTEKELTGHQGEGSSYKFTSNYAEQLVTKP